MRFEEQDGFSAWGLPRLAVKAELLIDGYKQWTKENTLYAVHGEIATFVSPHMAVHVEIIDHDFYQMKVEVQATHNGSLLYDGKTFLVHAGTEEDRTCYFLHENQGHTKEEFYVTLRVLLPDKE